MFQATNSTEESHSSQEILRILKNQKVNFSVHNSPSLVPNLSQINPVQPPHQFLENSLQYYPHKYQYNYIPTVAFVSIIHKVLDQ